jgi:hypothetical protein
MLAALLYWILALLGFGRGLASYHGLRLGWRRIQALGQLESDGEDPLPSLSIVVPARDEKSSVESAMRSLLEMDYPDLEIIAVDDRSTDGTGDLLDRLAAVNGKLRVIHVRDLPSGWLGKTYAMHLAGREARGEWILFTDADVHFEPTALRRAVRHVARRGADHLVVLPQVIVKSFWETLFLGFFWMLFSIRWNPTRAADPRSRHYIGVGAFNLVRAGAYRRAGGHEAMPMEVLDDVKLGKLMKRSGASQICVSSGGLVRVRWVAGLGGAVESLSKNTFAAFHYSAAFAVVTSLMLFVAAVWPAIGLFAGPTGARLICAATLGCMVLSIRGGVQIPELRPIHGLAYPIAALIFIYIIFRAMYRAYAHGGVIWRGTHYPLAELRKGLV